MGVGPQERVSALVKKTPESFVPSTTGGHTNQEAGPHQTLSLPVPYPWTSSLQNGQNNVLISHPTYCMFCDTSSRGLGYICISFEIRKLARAELEKLSLQISEQERRQTKNPNSKTKTNPMKKN